MNITVVTGKALDVSIINGKTMILLNDFIVEVDIAVEDKIKYTFNNKAHIIRANGLQYVSTERAKKSIRYSKSISIEEKEFLINDIEKTVWKAKNTEL